ncbi:MAG: site-specific integrase [Bacteroidetes bacterium]|nr:site-specific integrase [Bacteroidota bacterium]
MNAGIQSVGDGNGSGRTPGLFEVLRRELKLRNYSYKTFKAYRSHLREFTKYISPKHPRDLNEQDVRDYLLHLIQDKKLTAGTIGQVISAIRFLYVELYKRPFAIAGIPRPLKEQKLPVILSLDEVRRIFAGLGNKKHRIMLMLVYSAGLRVGEVVRLKPENIDSDRMMIHIRGGKGKKDRYTILSGVVLEGLRDYWRAYRPERWLFEGQEKGKPYTVRSAERVFEKAVKKAGVSKCVSIHSLRHAFATHLLEQGTDIRFIQELLGHSRVRTTEIYLHVSKKDLGQIRSPIDIMMQPKGKKPT